MAPDLQVWAVSGLASCFLVCDFDLLQASENLNKDGPATPYGLIEADCATRPVVLGMTEGPQGGRGSLPPVCADRPVRRPTFCTDSVTGPWGLSATANLWSAKVFNDPAREEQQRLLPAFSCSCPALTCTRVRVDSPRIRTHQEF